MATYDTDNIGPGPMTLVFVLVIMYFLSVPMHVIAIGTLMYVLGYVLCRIDVQVENGD